MPQLNVGDVTLHYEQAGDGDPVLLVPGSGARGRTWWLYQVPALVDAGYRVITVDNRGVGGSGPLPHRLTVTHLVADLAEVVERVAGGPCRLVGSSLGAHIIQELLVTRPELASQAVLMASRARPDAFSIALTAADRALEEHGPLPPAYGAVVRAMQNLSPRTLADEQAVSDWLDIFSVAPVGGAEDAGAQAQHAVAIDADRRPVYRHITTPCLVLSFADDLVAPPGRGRELARTIPGAGYVEIADAGHYGYLERPEPVNTAVLRFFAGGTFPNDPEESR